MLQFELWQKNWHEFLFLCSQFITRLILIIDLRDVRMQYLSLLSGKRSSFHLKEVLYSFSLAYLNCHYQYSSSLGSLLNKIKISWTQALRYHKSPSENQNSYSVAKGKDTWTKGWSLSRMKQSISAGDFIKLLRMLHNLKHRDCLFLKFSTEYLQIAVYRCIPSQGKGSFR